MGAKDGQKALSGEMRRRHEAIMRSGVMAKVRSEGRLVFAFGLMYADYASCEFKMSARGGAKVCVCQPTTFRRGIAQLRAAGVLQKGRLTKNGRHLYRFVVPTFGGAHEPCAEARTTGAPYSSMFLKGSSRTLEGVPQGSADASLGAASADPGRAPT